MTRMRIKNKIHFLLRVATLMAGCVQLVACSETRQALGLNRPAPDEFTVADRAPLAMPPGFTLRPPQPGAPRPQEQTPQNKAEQAVFGKTDASGPVDQSAATATQTGLTQELLTKMGADKVQSNVRAALDNDATTSGSASRHMVDDLLWWRKPDEGGTVVNAAQEALRLRANQQAGKSPNVGPTPTIEKRKDGWLGL